MNISPRDKVTSIVATAILAALPLLATYPEAEKVEPTSDYSHQPFTLPAPIQEAVEPHEDEAGFDCRIHGNQSCGVLIEDAWYVVTFEHGEPVSVVTR